MAVNLMVILTCLATAIQLCEAHSWRIHYCYILFTYNIVSIL